MSEKIQKILANAGVGSRREMERWIDSGRVSVNGKVAKLGDRAEDTDKIRVDGNVVKTFNDKKMCRVLMYNKPEGELCTNDDPEGRKTVFDRLPPLTNERWIMIGRLDINTSGLLLFTNDGELANRLMHPSYQVDREYAVRVFGEVTPQHIRQLEKGVKLADGWAKFDKIIERPRHEGDDESGPSINRWYNVTLSEGRNREVRRLWESQELTVSRLLRVRYGDLKLKPRLPQGAWVELELTEVNALRKDVQLPAETQTKVLHKEKKLSHRTLSQMRKAVKRHKTRIND